MKTRVKEEYWYNGNLWCRYHITTDGLFHGLHEVYHICGSISNRCYLDMGKQIKLENEYYNDVVEIIYYI